MKSIELIAIGIRLLGVYSILTALQLFASQYAQVQHLELISQLPSLLKILSIFIFPTIVLIAGIIMIKFPVLISRWLLPRTNSDEVVLDGSARDVQTALFCVLGAYILSWSIPNLIQNILTYWHLSSIEDIQYGPSTQYIIQGVVNIIDICIGLFLCLKASGLSQLLWKLRRAGT